MMTRDALNALKRALWPAESIRPVHVYAAVDCARDASIYDLLGRTYREKSCLFAGELEETLERAAPFLVELHPADSITDELLARGWTEAWGILIQTDGSMQRLRRHLRTLLRVRTEDGRFLLFRYYDPRVLHLYLPTCLPDELELVFGEAVERFVCWAPDQPGGWSYRLRSGKLERTQL